MIALWVPLSYFVAAVLLILGLKKMSSPVTARNGILWAGIGMLVATIATLTLPGLSNLTLTLLAIAAGSLVAWYSGKTVAMTDMPQMIALYNGLGGGAAAAIAAVELIHRTQDPSYDLTLPNGAAAIGSIGALIGAISFTGSLIAFAKLQGTIKKVFRVRGQQSFNSLIFAATILAGAYSILTPDMNALTAFFAGGLVYGLLMTLPIGGADMPVVISLYNALTGLAVGLEGYVLGNEAMIIAGTVVGAAGTLLTQLMAKAMNRSIKDILFTRFEVANGAEDTSNANKTMKSVEPMDAAVMLAYAQKVLIVPGYGMAVSQAQHKIWELAALLISKQIDVKFAIHPVAGRMPGHMNVLLAEAGVPYDIIADLDEINAEFQTTDVAIVVGANDVVNPVARTDRNSPIYGMPILNVDQARNVLVIKRGQGAGYSGVENGLFFMDNTQMIYGDAQKVAGELIQQIKQL